MRTVAAFAGAIALLLGLAHFLSGRGDEVFHRAMAAMAPTAVRHRDGVDDLTVRGCVNSTHHAFMAPDADVQVGDRLTDNVRMGRTFAVASVTPQMGYSAIDHLKVALRQPPAPKRSRR